MKISKRRKQKKVSNYWSQSSNYDEYKENSNFIILWNEETENYEKVKLSHYLNSFNEYKVLEDETIKKQNENVFKNLKEEIKKDVNVQNITNEEDDKKEQIRKLYQYIEEIKKEQGEK